MRTLTILATSTLLLSVSGCQHVHLMKKNPERHTSLATNIPEKTDDHLLKLKQTVSQFWTQQFGPASIQDYPAACLAQSKLNQPIVVGQVIDTPRYAMITLAKQHQQSQIMGGELCIFNKINHHIEITAVDDLRFVTPTSSQPENTPHQ